MGAALPGQINYAVLGVDDEVTAIFGAGRAALMLIAENVTAYDFFIGGTMPAWWAAKPASSPASHWS